ncbi:MAG: DUF4982 domain-containing protein [Bacteroidaceae bacterium]|nr:DUF4982 domain-containing protein [Bacteroidaceae bacterium]
MNRPFILLLLALLTSLGVNASPRKTCIDKDWQFRYEDGTWRQLNLPHDWGVDTDAAIYSGKKHIGPFVKEASDYQRAYILGGTGWYKKTLVLSPEDADKLITLYFEGAYYQATIFVNGQQAYFNHYGYQSFRADITKYLKPAGEENEILVKCENLGINTRWYSGSGIFRHVWLIKTPKVHLDEWETFIKTEKITPSGAVVSVSTNYPTAAIEILDANGTVVATSATVGNLLIPSAHIWSPDNPYLYKAVLTYENDEITIPFGIRTLEWNAEKGLLLNGESILLKGGCVHHDHGLLGAASFDRAEERKIQLMKDYGYNAVRCSHNLPSEKFLQACDSIGLMVIDECFDQWYVEKNKDDYHNYFPTHYLDDLGTMIRRDRNHPSVIMWSLGNEIPGRHHEDARIAAMNMRDLVVRLDGTRPTTAALCGWGTDQLNWSQAYDLVSASLDIVGYNYMWREYENDMKNHKRLICGTESYPREASVNWDNVEKYQQVVGDFVWTAMDYLGESGIGHGYYLKQGVRDPFFAGYPYFNGWCGDIDLIGQKKPQSYYRDVVWRNQPITAAMELPRPDGYRNQISGWGWEIEVNFWTDPSAFFSLHNYYNVMWDGDEGAKLNNPKAYRQPQISSKVNVRVYSRSPEVRLYLNDRLIDTKTITKAYSATFTVDYQPGTLRAVEWDGQKEGASFELKTPGKPVAIRLTRDEKRSELRADGTDIAYYLAELVDAEGNVVPEFERQVEFSVNGEGNILAAGNANPTDMGSFRINNPRLYNGQAMVIVQSTEKAGNITLTAKSKGMKSGKLNFHTL